MQNRVFVLKRFRHNSLYVISASYVLLGNLITIHSDTKLTNNQRKQMKKVLKEDNYNLEPAKNITLSDVIGFNRLQDLNARLVNGKMEIDLPEINVGLAVVNRKFVVTKNKFSHFSAYDLEAKTPFGYHPIEQFSEQPEWLLPHLNSNSIQSFNTKRSL